jgi:RNA polymerase sigma-70 factor (ECF subfamily)
MQLAAAGMLEAFGEIVRRHHRPLRAFCARMLGNAGHADDAAQDVLLEVWRSCARYEGQGRLRAFLLTCARNRCLRSARDRPPPRELGDQSAAAPADQLDALLAAERRRRIDRALERLAPKLREAIALRFSGGLEYREIADLIGKPEETIRSRVFLGLKRLRAWLGHEHEDAGRKRSRT